MSPVTSAAPEQSRARRYTTLGASLLVLAATGILNAPAAEAATQSRVAGHDMYATAAAVSRTTFPTGVPAAYVVAGNIPADAVLAGPVAARRGAPVLPVTAGGVPAAVGAELTRLAPKEIIVVGGTGGVPETVRVALDKYTTGPVKRIAGVDVTGTAIRLSWSAWSSSTTVVVTNPHMWADGVAIAPAAKRLGAPLLVAGSGLPAGTVTEIRRLKASRVIIVGGTAGVSATSEQQLRNLGVAVERWNGSDRFGTSAILSARTHPAGVQAVHLVNGGMYNDGATLGAAASRAGGPVLLVRGNCIPRNVLGELNRLAPQRIVLVGGENVLFTGVEERNLCPYAAPLKTPRVTIPAGPAYNGDAPDPALVRFGSTYYTFTTGTTWGNNLGVLKSSSPGSGWGTVTGKTYGSTALANIPSWQRNPSQWAPGVYRYAGKYIMFYAAQARAHNDWCLSVATSSTPQGPYTDRTTGPIVCQRDLGGSIDPMPFVDANGKAWLHWKNNDGFNSAAVSRVWAAPLAADGVTINGAHRLVLSKDSAKYPWQTTVDNPHMVLIGGQHYLFHTGGAYEGDSSYATGYARCAGPAGPCTTAANPILRTYGNVAGPGGGNVLRDAAGKYWLSYHAWTTGCYNYSCGGKRKLYIAPLTFS